MLRTSYAQFAATIQPPRQLYSSSPTPISQGLLGIPTCPVGRLKSPQAASNPHTSTALAA
jgi:hypothetical protein